MTFVLQPLDVDGHESVSALAGLVDRLEVVGAPHFAEPSAWGFRRVSTRLAKAFLPGHFLAGIRRVLQRRHHEDPGTSRSREGGVDHIDRWCWPVTCGVVERAVHRDRPIAVLTEYALLSKCLERVPAPVLKVIDTVEIFFREPHGDRAEGLSLPFVCTPESERAALSRADLLIAIQRNDAQALNDLFPEKHVITVPHTYPHVRRRAANPARGTVLYVGSSNPFNVHGLRHFLDHAWPSILKRVSGVTLRMVGSVPMPQNSSSHLVHVGLVSDEVLAREYQTAHVVINPQVAGTGLKIKCVEALSAGCPVVMNQAGADGLEEGAGTAFLMAMNWRDFSNHVVTILTDEAIRLALEAEARRFAARMFSADRVFSELARALIPDSAAPSGKSR